MSSIKMFIDPVFLKLSLVMCGIMVFLVIVSFIYFYLISKKDWEIKGKLIRIVKDQRNKSE